MSSINQFYVAFAVVDLLLLIPLYFSWKSHSTAWYSASRFWHYFFLIDAVLFLVVAMGIWIFIVMISYDSWRVSMDLSRPKPTFLVLWTLAVFGYGLALGVAQPLNAFVRNRK